MITGESVPIDKTVGDSVIGATINKNGFLKIKATKVGKETALSQIIKIVEEAQGSKAPIQRMADLISGILFRLSSGLRYYFFNLVFMGRSRKLCLSPRKINCRSCYCLPMCSWSCNTNVDYGWFRTCC